MRTRLAVLCALHSVLGEEVGTNALEGREGKEIGTGGSAEGVNRGLA